MNVQQKNKIWLILSIVLALVAVISGAIFALNSLNQKKAEDKLADLQESVTSVIEDTTVTEEKINPTEPILQEKISLLEEKYGIKIPEKNLDFEKLKAEINQDIYAWIYVPGTKVDYPIVQHPTDNDYYLDYNYDGSKGFPGTIYTQNYNDKDFTDRNTVVYGHNMKNGSMFATLHNYADREFFDANRYIYIYTEDDIFVYKIFAAHEFNSIHLLLSFDLSQDEIFLNYLNSILDSRDMRSNIDKSVEFDEDTKIITLSTCVNSNQDNRYLVQGELLIK